MEISHTKRTIILGLPKGRFAQYSWELVQYFMGWEVRESRRLSHKVERGGYHLVIKLLKMPDIAALLSQGELDAGVLCDEWGFEYGLEKNARNKLHWCRSDIVLAAPRYGSLKPSAIRTIATSFPRLAKHLLDDTLGAVKFVHITGSTEAAVPEFADAIVDCVETGGTLEDNDLVPLVWLTSTNVRIFLSSGHDNADIIGISEEIERVGIKKKEFNHRCRDSIQGELIDLR